MVHNVFMGESLYLRRAAFFAIIFLIVALIVRIFIVWLTGFKPVTNGEYFINITAWALAYSSAFALYGLMLTGYLHIARMYKLPYVAGSIYACFISMVLIVATSVSDFLATLPATANIFFTTPDIIGFIFVIPYCFAPTVISFALFPLRERLSLIYALFGVGLITLTYGIYVFGTYFTGIDAPAFLGDFVWKPIPESLFAIVSALLFLQISRR
jgi:hypothetical protein